MMQGSRRQTVVVGAQGQLGSELCRQLGSQAVGLDLPAFDLTDRRGVLRILAGAAPPVVINTAAYTRVDDAEQDHVRCREINETGVAHLVEACRQTGSVLIQISTDYVFGGDAARSTPYRETDLPAPQSVYAKTKLAGEDQARRWEKHFIVRTCGLYGGPAPRSAGNFVSTMLRLAETRQKIRVVRDQRLTPSYVPHVARAILFLRTTEAFGTYHVVNAGQTTWFEFASEIFRVARCQVQLQAVTSADYPAKATRPRYSVLDTSKYHALPGGPAMPDWHEALAECLSQRQGW
jgi:dTDP-4-dehydrorhamnose reductase